MTDALLQFDKDEAGGIRIRLSGDWQLKTDPPDLHAVLTAIDNADDGSTVVVDGSGIGAWDTGLVSPLVRIRQHADSRGIDFEGSNLPEGAARLLGLAFAVPEREGARRKEKRDGLFREVGERTLEIWASAKALLTFTGEVVLSLGRMIRGKATYLRSDLVQYIQEAGAEALPIVSLISFLIGSIFAFVGVMQLENFGAGIYTADLVAIAMVREMAPIMTAILMAGRTGAAYAAQIGTMKVNEEIDALTTLGIDPIDFLVTPRVIALIVMMPLLTLYASLLGIIGGTAVGLAMVDVTFVQYAAQSIDAVGLDSLFGGLFKSTVYGILIALAGCQQGMACGNSAMAVGQSTTRAVVMGIVLIVVSASVLTIIYINLGI
jgi:phospholipid/cholesterol/gamma-HCH transport system permease protein